MASEQRVAEGDAAAVVLLRDRNKRDSSSQYLFLE